MATFLSSALVAVLLQAPPPGGDTLMLLRARVARDSGDAGAWFQLGLGLMRVAADYHRHVAGADTVGTRAALDTADLASTRAAALEPSTARADSARAFRVCPWGDSAGRARVANDLRLGRAPPRRARGVPWIELLAARRPVCASMGFARPPDDGSRVQWSTRPLVWVTGSGAARDPVPPQDFGFAAL